jgi:hypothetical protein
MPGSPGHKVAPSVAGPGKRLALAHRVTAHLDPAVGSQKCDDLISINQIIQLERRNYLVLTIFENDQHVSILHKPSWLRHSPPRRIAVNASINTNIVTLRFQSLNIILLNPVSQGVLPTRILKNKLIGVNLPLAVGNL